MIDSNNQLINNKNWIDCNKDWIILNILYIILNFFKKNPLSLLPFFEGSLNIKIAEPFHLVNKQNSSANTNATFTDYILNLFGIISH